MNNEQINIAIAESLGVPTQAGPYSYPYYCNDLNAMHEVENTLDVKGLEFSYANILYNICVPLNKQPCRATALQRAEAYLRTIGKWVEA